MNGENQIEIPDMVLELSEEEGKWNIYSMKVFTDRLHIGKKVFDLMLECEPKGLEQILVTLNTGFYMEMPESVRGIYDL